MTKLNLPEYSFRILKTEKGFQVFDSLRKKFVALTPEEWVRQHFIQYLVQEKNCPASLISVETGMKYNRLNKRSDLAVHDRKGMVWMIVECKSPKVKITDETFRQAAVYNMAGKTKTLYLAVTNGLEHYCCRMNYDKGKLLFLKDFPLYPDAVPTLSGFRAK